MKMELMRSHTPRLRSNLWDRAHAHNDPDIEHDRTYGATFMQPFSRFQSTRVQI